MEPFLQPGDRRELELLAAESLAKIEADKVDPC